jgi:hypothetical protein
MSARTEVQPEPAEGARHGRQQARVRPLAKPLEHDAAAQSRIAHMDEHSDKWLGQMTWTNDSDDESDERIGLKDSD